MNSQTGLEAFPRVCTYSVELTTTRVTWPRHFTTCIHQKTQISSIYMTFLEVTSAFEIWEYAFIGAIEMYILILIWVFIHNLLPLQRTCQNNPRCNPNPWIRVPFRCLMQCHYFLTLPIVRQISIVLIVGLILLYIVCPLLFFHYWNCSCGVIPLNTCTSCAMLHCSL